MRKSLKTLLAAGFGVVSLTAWAAPSMATPRMMAPEYQSNLVHSVRVHCRGHRCWDDHYDRHHYHSGIYLGLGGVYVGPPVYVPPRVYRHDPYRAHVRWCMQRYRSYDPRTDTFMTYKGYRKRCRSPY